MQLRLFVSAFAFALTTLAAHAQAGLYLNPIALRVSNSVADTGPYAFLGQNTTSRMFYGVNFGGYYDLLPGQKFNLGVDLRDSIVHGNNASLNSFLIGPRLAAKPLRYRLRPYIQPEVGLGTSRSPTTLIHISKIQYGIFGGLDAAINAHVDFRVVEVGYGSVTTVSSETVGGTAAIPAAGVLSISSGLVFRIP